MKKIYASQVDIGIRLSCDIYNARGVLLWAAEAEIKTERQVQKLIKEGYHSDFQEWVPSKTSSKVVEELQELEAGKLKKVYVYSTVMDALTEIQFPLNNILDTLKADAFHKEKRDLTRQIALIVDFILDVCERYPEESLATINMFIYGKYVVLHAMAKCVIACLIGQILQLSEAKKRNVASAALTANCSIIKFTELMCKQSSVMTDEQKLQFTNHPFDSVMPLTKAGVRDSEWLDVVLMHHECMDGSGFPKGMSEDDIPLLARIIAIADLYVTMILPKQAMQLGMDSPSALKKLYKKYGKKIDFTIVADFVKKFGTAPPGTFVKLKDGKIGLVICNSDDSSKPIITKVGDNTTKFYTEFYDTRKYKIAKIVHAPNNIPKRLCKLWEMYRKKNIKLILSEGEQ